MFSCPADIIEWAKCDHRSSALLFIESVLTQSPLRAYPCANMEDFARGRCTQCSGGQCPSMGYDADKTEGRASGKHYLYTNEAAPPYSGNVYDLSKLTDYVTNYECTVSMWHSPKSANIFVKGMSSKHRFINIFFHLKPMQGQSTDHRIHKVEHSSGQLKRVNPPMAKKKCRLK